MQTILTSPTLAWLTCKFVPTHKTYLDTVNGMTVVIYKHGCQTSIATTLERHRCALPRLHGAECFQADFRRRSKWRHEFALCEARIRLLQVRSRVQNARVRQLDHTTTLPDHSQ